MGDPLLLPVEGTPLGRDVLVEVTAVVTASTPAQVRTATEALELVVERTDTHITIKIGGLPSCARTQGNLHAVVPSRLDLGAKAPGGAVVRGMEGDIDLITAQGAEVYEAKGSVVVPTSGGAIVDSLLLQSTVLDVQATGGSASRYRSSSAPRSRRRRRCRGVSDQAPALAARRRRARRVRGVRERGLETVRAKSTVGTITFEARQ